MEYSVDILLAVYNGKKYIDNQIQSIINQSHKYWNLFILDDCSTDGTYEYLIKNYSCFEKIFINRNNRNSGVIKTFEQLLNYSKSGFFAFCDQDDVWDRNKLSLLLTKILKSKVDIVYSDLRLVDEDLNILSDSKFKYSNTPPYRGKKPISIIFKNPVSGCSLLARKEIIPHILPFPSDIPMHDRWISLIACLNNGIDYIPNATMSYRQHYINDTGGVKFSIYGLKQRIMKDGKGNFIFYYKERLRKKAVLLKYLIEDSRSNGNTHIVSILLYKSISSKLVKKYLYFPVYVFLILFFTNGIGMKNKFVDILFYLLPITIEERTLLS